MSWNLETAKVVSLVALGGGSLVLGLLPLRLTPRASPPGCPRHAAVSGPVLTTLLAFGAGALLATALVHMLPEAMGALPQAAAAAMLAGFLALYIIDELVQRVLGHSPAVGRAHQEQPHPACPVDQPCTTSGRSGRQSLYRKHVEYGSLDGGVHNKGKRPSMGVEAVVLLPETAANERSADAHLRSGPASCWGLLMALCIHSIIEGLAVGLEDTPRQVLFLLAAVSSHKLVVSFCLGAELVAGAVGLIPHILAVIVFSVGSSAGVGLGMALFGIPDVGDWPILPALQAMAGGTLLYVTLAEVLPRERARAKHSFPRRMLQLAAFTAGAGTISAFVYTLDVGHNHGVEPLGPG